MSNLWFTSDLHIGHGNFLEHRSTAWGKLLPTAEAMNEALVDQWNSQVRPRDLVWVLGDVAWKDKDLHWLSQMVGRKRLVLGNHDKLPVKQYWRYFEEIRGVIKKYGVVLSHCPIHPQELEYRNWATNVHGHIHYKGQNLPSPQYINVNLDVVGGKLISLEEIKSKIGESSSNKQN